MLSALINNRDKYNFNIKEKLKTLYLKQPWMYDEKIFRLNPLYLNNWDQLSDFDIDLLLLYSNHIPYEKNSNNDKFELSYRIIDIITGEIIFIGSLK